ncbi:MAG: cupin domain-containing protein, partial [Bacillota bacterium]
VYFKKGGIGEAHSHADHEQVCYVEKGSFEVTVEGKKDILKSGDCFYAAKGKKHGVKALEDGILLDVFTPIREDFLN